MRGRVGRTAWVTLAAWAWFALPAASDAASERVDRIMSAFARSDGPGCAVGVSRDGEMLLERGYGLANLDHDVPIEPGTVFDVGSVSKQFTAAAVLLLADDGLLDLDDPVRRHVPELPDYGAPLTLRHLVHHTGGVRDYLELQELAGVSARSVSRLDELVALIARQRELNFAPGAAHLYSNSGYILLAAVAERVSGRSLGAFLEERIFRPLGMDRSLVYEDATRVIPGRATGYAPRPGGGWAVDHYYEFAVPGDGQVYTTVGDLARWDRALSRDAVGGRGFAARLLERGVLSDGTHVDYAFGLRRGEHRGLETVRHGGAWGGFRAHFLRYPGAGLAVSCLCNDASAEPEDLAEAVAEVFLEDEMQDEAEVRPSFQPSIVALEGLAATFREERSGEVWQVRLRRGSLHARALDGRPERRLRPVAPGRFEIEGDPGAEVRFEAGRDGRRQLRLDRDGALVARLEEADPAVASPSALAALAGRYFSDELDVTWTLAPTDGGLDVEMSGGAGFGVWPSVPDVFVSEDRVLRFERDAAGAVSGLLVHTGPVKNLRFVRSGS